MTFKLQEVEKLARDKFAITVNTGSSDEFSSDSEFVDDPDCIKICALVRDVLNFIRSGKCIALLLHQYQQVKISSGFGQHGRNGRYPFTRRFGWLTYKMDW